MSKRRVCLTHFLSLCIQAQNPAIPGFPMRNGQGQKPGKEFGPKTAFIFGQPRLKPSRICSTMA